MQTRIIYYGLGVATPFLFRLIRPIAKAVLKGGLIAAGRAQRLLAETREDLADLAAEASEEANAFIGTEGAESTPTTGEPAT